MGFADPQQKRPAQATRGPSVNAADSDIDGRPQISQKRRPPAMPDADAEDLIASLAGGLHPDDRSAFRQAAEAALASSAQCWGPGSIHRTLVPVWRKFFRPPTADERGAHEHRAPSKLIDAPAIGREQRYNRTAE
jgi:hypothetical protein